MVSQEVRKRLRGIASTPDQAAVKLAEINARILRGQPITESLQRRLDLYYLATNSGPKDYEPVEDEPAQDW